ncbi:uncharacterized protein BO96DRAFT_463928 [Aspergillus niger CBS 101883]|uniref:uncharacterized protein n=1 Tax=Aspergillus lacticoffeatus (strain CBS 101883) TaxID=1450533 RepID=UPI000D7F0146|nr:uncharacterized protein BO96DRAFT_463928 [Aspergillus niger CBS 101883]PYH59460.1 hypothetical protein BO96DRAFT_463928 [Aspergillus niger CBS 101883]
MAGSNSTSRASGTGIRENLQAERQSIFTPGKRPSMRPSKLMHNKSSKEGGGGGNWAGKPASQQKERPGMRREELAESKQLYMKDRRKSSVRVASGAAAPNGCKQLLTFDPNRPGCHANETPLLRSNNVMEASQAPFHSACLPRGDFLHGSRDAVADPALAGASGSILFYVYDLKSHSIPNLSMGMFEQQVTPTTIAQTSSGRNSVR